MSAVITTLLGVVGGAIAGFATSYFFWNKDRLKDKPRLIIEVANPPGYKTAIFSVRNTGFIHADNVVVTNLQSKRKLLKADEIRADQTKQFEVLREYESSDIRIEFEDVWGHKYQSEWHIEGPKWEGIDLEGHEGFFSPFWVIRKEELEELTKF